MDAVSWIKYKKPRTRIAQYSARLLNRLETEFKFTFPTCYISTNNNTLGDQLSRVVFPWPKFGIAKMGFGVRGDPIYLQMVSQ